MTERKSLSAILQATGKEEFDRLWAQTTPAPEFGPIPTGEYQCHITGGELFKSRFGTPGYKLTFKVIHGPYAGRFLWLDCWLTEAALPGTMRDLAKLGITSPDLLEHPLPTGFRCQVRVALRTADDGTTSNAVKGFTVIEIDASEADPFAPADADLQFPPADSTERGG